MFNVIKSSREISALFNSGTFWSSRNFSIIYEFSDETKVAFIAGKKLGKAHTRNFLKRRLRHLYCLNQDLFGDKRVLLIAKKGLIDSDFLETNKQIKRFRVRKRERITN